MGLTVGAEGCNLTQELEKGHKANYNRSRFTDIRMYIAKEKVPKQKGAEVWSLTILGSTSPQL